MKYYRPNSTPLQPIKEENIKAGEAVYNELGQYVRKVYVQDSLYFIEVLESALHEGEVMSELTPKQLELFWALSRTKLHKYENKDRGQRRRVLS